MYRDALKWTYVSFFLVQNTRFLLGHTKNLTLDGSRDFVRQESNYGGFLHILLIDVAENIMLYE